MNFGEMQRYVLDTLQVTNDDRRTKTLIKTCLNNGYRKLAEKDCTPKDFSFAAPLARTQSIPTDLLKVINLKHSEYGTLQEGQYKITPNLLVLAKKYYADDTFTLDLLYAVAPVDMTLDADEPAIQIKYQIAICYYALYEIGKDANYLQMFKDIFDEIPDFEINDDDEEPETIHNAYPLNEGDE